MGPRPRPTRARGRRRRGARSRVRSRRWVATVDDPCPRPLGRQPDKLGEVRNRRRVEDALAVAAEHDNAPPVQRAFDEEPLTRKRRPRAVDRTRPHDSHRDGRAFEQRPLDRDLSGRVGRLARLDGFLGLRDRNRQDGKVVRAGRLIERSAIGVRVHRGTRHGNERANAARHREQLRRVVDPQRDQVHQDVYTISESCLQLARLGTVNRHETNPLGHRPSAASGNSHLPTGLNEPIGKRPADLARPAKHECCPRHPRMLDRPVSERSASSLLR